MIDDKKTFGVTLRKQEAKPEARCAHAANPCINEPGSKVSITRDHRNASIVYKITSLDAWRTAERNGALAPSSDDARDGYIHLSAGHQVAETARKYFKGKPGLCLVAYDAAALGSSLVWEPSRGGDLFPHFYGSLPTAAALWSRPLPLDADGAPATLSVIDQTS